MSQSIVQESVFLFHSIILGIGIAFFYDLIRVFRRVIPHGTFFVALEDLLFWISCSLIMFIMLYYENSGTIRWFSIAGAGLGMLLYINTVGRIFAKSVSLIIIKTEKGICKILKTLWKPFASIIKKITGFVKKLGKKIYRIIKKIGRFLKRRIKGNARETKAFCKRKRKM